MQNSQQKSLVDLIEYFMDLKITLSQKDLLHNIRGGFEADLEAVRKELKARLDPQPQEPLPQPLPKKISSLKGFF